LLAWRSWGIDVAKVGQELGGELGSGQLGDTRRRDLLQDPGGLSCGDLLRVTAGDQVAQHRVQPAGNLVASPAQVTVPLGPHLQHRRVVIGAHLAPGCRPQCRDRERQGIVRVVLIGVAGLQQPYPRRQLRLHIQHPLARGDQLLGQQPP
jgi:hypothetical protein